MHSKKSKEEFHKYRKHKKDANRTPLMQSVRHAKDLEKHIANFISGLKKDKNADPEMVVADIIEFEDALLEEFQELSGELKKGVSKSLLTIKKWAELKDHSEKFQKHKHLMHSTITHEVKLAEELVKSIHSKLESIEKIGRRLK